MLISLFRASSHATQTEEGQDAAILGKHETMVSAIRAWRDVRVERTSVPYAVSCISACLKQ